MDKKFGKEGLRILGLEMQESALKDIQKVVDQHKIAYPIIHGMGKKDGEGSTQPDGLAGGIPYAVVFDVSGKVVFEGKSTDQRFEEAIVKALKEIKKEAPPMPEKVPVE